MKFKPNEILFALTTNCNLNCSHCVTIKTKKNISKKVVLRFLEDCKKIGIEKVGFTGGEPFLVPDLLCVLVKETVKHGMLFDRIMTNAVWAETKTEIKNSLYKLYHAGYDGEICVSVDAFHKQDLKTVSYFIKTAIAIWKRNDIISITYVSGAREQQTHQKLQSLAQILETRLTGFGKSYCYMRNKSFFIKVLKIDLSPVGKASVLKNPWDGNWFKEDYCQGPGNTFFVMPNGDVKPCCGYATDLNDLTIGNIKQDTPKKIMNNIRKNWFIYTVFNSGLSQIRKRLQNLGIKFPGKTSNHCYFCYYILTKIAKHILYKCMD